jgi:LAO/AO transport system kinase
MFNNQQLTTDNLQPKSEIRNVKPHKPKSALSVQPGVEQPSNVNEELITKLKNKDHPTSLPPYLPTSQLIDGILSGNRTLLAKAITLVESNRPEHQQQAQEIIAECLRHSKSEVRSTKLELEVRSTKDEVISGIRYPASGIRIGITGVPGVGKSTFIEALGKHLTARGHKLAVLAVDPSSTISKGSILGDKTRMESLAVDPNAFIRPSPSAGSLGGVARKTRETIYLCEAAGFDVIFVETVGVGQSETVVKSMVDFFLLLMLAGAGDELQGIKRGIIEMADAVIINKADGDNIARAKIAFNEYTNALHLFPPAPTGWIPAVGTCSARTGEGIPHVWEIIRQFCTTMQQKGHFRQNRTDQNQLVFQQAIEEKLKEQFYNNKAIRKQILELEKKIREGTLNPYQAANSILDTGY